METKGNGIQNQLEAYQKISSKINGYVFSKQNMKCGFALRKEKEVSEQA